MRKALWINQKAQAHARHQGGTMNRRTTVLTVAVLIGILALGWAALVPKSLSAAPDGFLTGAVKSAAGDRLAGATVSAKLEGSTVTTSIFTDDQGNYYFPAMNPGKYQVWAQVTTYETGKSEVELAATRHQDFVLKPLKDFEKQLTSDVLFASMPETTREEKQAKLVFKNTCTSCHPSEYILQNRFDEEGWTAITNLMMHISVTGPFLGLDAPAEPHILYNQKLLTSYLAKVRGPGPTTMKFKLRDRPTGEVARSVVTEYDVPVDPAQGYDTEYITNTGSDWSLGTPSSSYDAHGIHDAQADLDGNIWFAYNIASPDISYGRIDAKTGEVKFIKVPGRGGAAASGHGITRDRQGNLWANIGPGPEAGSLSGLARIEPASQKIDVFRPDKGQAGVGGTIDVDGKGFVWASTNTGATRFDPNSHEWKEFKSPTQIDSDGNPDTYGVAATRDGNAFWAQMNIDMVARSDIETGKTAEIKVPAIKEYLDLFSPEAQQMNLTSGSSFTVGAVQGEGPRRLGADKNGDVVWVCDSWGSNLARIDTKTNKLTLVPLPSSYDHPYQAQVDSNHNVWVNMMNDDRVLRYDPKAGKWDSFPLPSMGSESRYVSLLERDGQLQVIVPYQRARKVARLIIRTPEEMQALKNQVQWQQAQR
jgi:virginiamycin B lyase